jgi:hypothetical protein
MRSPMRLTFVGVGNLDGLPRAGARPSEPPDNVGCNIGGRPRMRLTAHPEASMAFANGLCGTSVKKIEADLKCLAMRVKSAVAGG